MVEERVTNPPMADEAKVLAHQIAGCSNWINGDEIELSNADVRVEVVKKSASVLDESRVKGTEIRQKQHLEFVTLTEINAGGMESLKLAQRCGNQSLEREEGEKSMAEELQSIHEMIKLLSDDDTLELFKGTSRALLRFRSIKAPLR